VGQEGIFFVCVHLSSVLLTLHGEHLLMTLTISGVVGSSLTKEVFTSGVKVISTWRFVDLLVRATRSLRSLWRRLFTHVRNLMMFSWRPRSLHRRFGSEHRKHLREAGSVPCNSFIGVTEGQLGPGIEFSNLTLKVGETFCARSTRESSQRLLAEHCILFSAASWLHVHDEVIEVLELFLERFEGLFDFRLVCKLVLQRL